MAANSRINRQEYTPAQVQRRLARNPVVPSERRKIDNLDSVSSGNEELVKICNAAKEAAFNGDKYLQYRSQAVRSRQVVHGDQWPTDVFEGGAPKWRWRATDNRLFPAVEAITSLEMDQLPVGYFVPDVPVSQEQMREAAAEAGFSDEENPFSSSGGGTGSNDIIKAKQLTGILQGIHEGRDELGLLSDVIMDKNITGFSCRKVFLDRTRFMPDVKLFDGIDVGIDPEAERRMQSSKFMIVRKWIDAEDVGRRWKLGPEKMGRLIAAAGEDAGAVSSFYRRRQRRMNPSAILLPESREAYTETLERVRLEVFELWFMGQSLHELEHKEQRGLNYPSGRVVVWCGEELLHDGHNPFAHGMLPFVFFRNYGDARDPYGYGDVKPNMGNQFTMNILLSMAVSAAALCGNPQFLSEEGAWMHGTPSNEPGLDIQLAKGYLNRVRRLEGTGVSPSTMSLIDRLSKTISDVTSVNETTQGQMPQSHTSGLAVQLAQNMNLARIRRKGRDMEIALRRQYLLEGSLIAEYGSKIDPSSLRMDEGEWSMWQEGLKNLKVDVRIESRAEMPAGFAAKMKFAAEGMQAGMMDPLQAIDFTDYPVGQSFKKLLDVKRQVEIAKAEKELSELQAPPPPPEGMVGPEAMGGDPAMAAAAGGAPPAAPPTDAGAGPSLGAQTASPAAPG